MKRLLVMRHAKSSWEDKSLPDHKRPLNERGQRDAPQMGQYLARMDCVPDLILSSTADRAVSTARLVVSGLGRKVPVGLEKILCDADVEEFCDVVRFGADAENNVLVISHNPGVERWVYALTGEFETMPTASVAVIDLPDKLDWSDINSLTKGTLANVWRPKEVLV